MTRYYTTTDEKEADRYIEHRDEIARSEGHQIPETAAQLSRGRRCGPEVIPDSAMLAQHWTDKQKHPTKKQWSIAIPESDDKYADHETTIKDPETGLNVTHKLDHKGAVDELPADWTDDLQAIG